MDEQVIAAMSRWPDIPAVFGWLSLNRQGQWRIHPQGDSGSAPHGHPAELSEGEAITNPQILQFINRNYCGDAQGRWYFQNGPQRVFVRLDAAPYILRTAGKGTGIELQTHTGLSVRRILGWWLDDEGKLYASTEHGPGLIAGRDTTSVFDALRTADGQPVLDVLDPAAPGHPLVIAPLNTTPEASTAPMQFCQSAQIPELMEFTRSPAPDTHEERQP